MYSAIERITKPRIVKLVVTAEEWDICFGNTEHHDRLRLLVEIRAQKKQSELSKIQSDHNSSSSQQQKTLN